MPRWSELETALLREVRLRLGDEISNTGQYPEVAMLYFISLFYIDYRLLVIDL